MSRAPAGGLHAALVCSLRVPGAMRAAALAEVGRILDGCTPSRRSTVLAEALEVSDRSARRLALLYAAACREEARLVARLERARLLAEREGLERVECGKCRQRVIMTPKGLETHPTAPFLRDICPGSAIVARGASSWA